jgi:hypothetical protein
MLCFRRRTLLRRKSIEAAVSHHGLWLIEPVPGYSRGVELGAIRFCYVVAVNGRCPCRDQLRGRSDATRWDGPNVAERFWADCCSDAQRVHRQLGHKQAAAVVPEKRDDDTCDAHLSCLLVSPRFTETL